MDDRGKADDLIRQFGETVGLTGLELDPDGMAVVTFDDLFVLLGLPQGDDVLRLSTALPGSEGPKTARLLEDLLIANAHGEGTNGATIAIDGSNGPVLLQRYLPLADLRYHAFESVLEGFLKAASALAAHVRLAKIESPVIAEPAEPADELFLIRA